MTRISYSQLEDILKKILNSKVLCRFHIHSGRYEAFSFDPVNRKIALWNSISGDLDDIQLDEYPYIFTTDYAIVMFKEEEYIKYEEYDKDADRLIVAITKEASIAEVMEYCNNLSTTNSNN